MVIYVVVEQAPSFLGKTILLGGNEFGLDWSGSVNAYDS